MASFQFGSFQLDGARRLLVREGHVVPLAPKALELLELLILERHRTLSKTELLSRLWPDTIVAENNLTVTMSALRKALGESAAQPRYLQTLSRRGYRFVENTAERGPEPLPPSSSSPARLQRAAWSAEEHDGENLPSQLVGRDAERRHLEQRLARSLAGAGRVVFVTGEPGIGKTALCQHFVDAARRREKSLLVLSGRALEQFGRGEGYLPWLDAWGALLAGPLGEQARDVLRQVAPSWCREFPGMFPEQAARADESVTRERLLREMGGALAALAARQPLLILLEDLHWADAASCDLLRWVSERSRQHRWLVIGTFRSVEAGLLNAPLESLRREALQHDECDELRLPPLGADQVEACLSAQFATNDFPKELARVLYQRTEGHPLFLTRLLSFLAQREDVVERSGVWTLARPLERLALEVPEDVRAMVRRKLDSLEGDALLALRHASVAGDEFSSRLLAGLLGTDVLSIEERLQPLEAEHRLIETLGHESWPDGELSTRYRFAHALYQNELYAGLVSGRRVMLHRRTAELLIEYAGSDSASPQRSRLAATLAGHFERGRELPRAINFLQEAAQNAHRLCAYAEEERLHARTIELSGELEEPARSQRKAQALLGLAWAVYDAGQAERAERILQELLGHARHARLPELECEGLRCLCAITFESRLRESQAFAEEQRRAAQGHGLARYELQAIVSLIGISCADGNFSEALRRSEEIFPAVQALADRHLLAMQWMNMGWAFFSQSRFGAAEAAYLEALDYWGGLSRLMVLRCWSALGSIRPHLGQLAAGLAAFREALVPGEPELVRSQQERSYDGIGWILREAGDCAGALAHHQAGIARARSHDAPLLERSFTIELSLDHLALGDLEEAGAALSRARALMNAQAGRPAFPCWARRTEQRLLAARARHALAIGDRVAAARAARVLLELAALEPCHEHLIQAHELLARIALSEGDSSCASTSLEAALSLLAQFPSALLSWRVHALGAEVHTLLGASDAARAHAERAREVIAQLGTDLRALGLEQTFLDSPAVRAARSLSA